MQVTKSERPHIAFFGCRNAGKSSLVNAVTNQELSVVSDIKGTTTDPVQKAMEILPLGPVVIIDTAGLDDEGELGELRKERTMRVLEKTDIAVLVVDSTVGQNEYDRSLVKLFEEKKLPYIIVYNKSDLTLPPNPLPHKSKFDLAGEIAINSFVNRDSGNDKLNYSLLDSGVNNVPQKTESYPPLEGGSKSLISGWGNNASHKYNKLAQINAIELRNNSTEQERKLWKYLNKSQLGHKFRRQQPIGMYIVDFFCPEFKLIIELDGGQHNKEQKIEYDEKRTEFLNKQGYKVLRIWNNEVNNNIEGVIEYIKMHLTPPPNPLPQGAGGCVCEPEQDLSPQGAEECVCEPEQDLSPQGAGECVCEPEQDLPPQGAGGCACEPEQDISPQGAGGITQHAKTPTTLSSVEEIYVSAKTGEGVNELRELLGKIFSENKVQKYIIRHKLKQGDIVVLVIPIDESAPKGRIILPQQNVLRECLDAHSTAVCCQVDELSLTLKKITPNLVITDSQVFNKVKDIVPENIILTSFSILMANYRGKLDALLKGVEKLSNLDNGDTVLISEGCTHHRQCNDIGTVKFPKWIKDFTKKEIRFEYTQGGEFPSDLSKYKLVIHCGGCMINDAEMQFRMNRATKQNIPMVNYGMAIAYMNGILDRALEIFKG